MKDSVETLEVSKPIISYEDLAYSIGEFLSKLASTYDVTFQMLFSSLSAQTAYMMCDLCDCKVDEKLKVIDELCEYLKESVQCNAII